MPVGSYPVKSHRLKKRGHTYRRSLSQLRRGQRGTDFGHDLLEINGNDAECGVVDELTPSDDGWTETVLYNFQGDTDGATANSTPVLDPLGNLYGTTAYGGDPNCVPVPAVLWVRITERSMKFSSSRIFPGQCQTESFSHCRDRNGFNLLIHKTAVFLGEVADQHTTQGLFMVLSQ